jgi:hypothetical protein
MTSPQGSGNVATREVGYRKADNSTVAWRLVNNSIGDWFGNAGIPVTDRPVVKSL